MTPMATRLLTSETLIVHEQEALTGNGANSREDYYLTKTLISWFYTEVFWDFMTLLQPASFPFNVIKILSNCASSRLTNPLNFDEEAFVLTSKLRSNELILLAS